MNHRMSAIAAIVTAAVLTVISSTMPMTVYADESETSTDQKNKQKNVGSGDSFNNNCAENLIHSDTGDDDCQLNNLPRDSESATLSVCKDVATNEPVEFAFTVTGNGPSPAQFLLGDEECVDVNIGPGDFTVTENSFSPRTFITGDCVQDPPGGPVTQRATGEIQAGETQKCLFKNETD